MENLVPHFIELIRRASTDLPADMEIALRRARANEDPDSAAQTALDAILENVQLSRQGSTPICQDTGTPDLLCLLSHGLVYVGPEEADSRGDGRGHCP